MKLQVTNMSYELDNEDGLNSLFFEYDGGYFTIARMDEDENIYLEKDDQSNGQYFDPDCFEYNFRNGEMALIINLNNIRILQYLKDNNLNADLYRNITLIFEPVRSERFKEMGNTLDRIFER